MSSMASRRTVVFGLVTGLMIPGGAQWWARRWWTGLVFLASALVVLGYAMPQDGWTSAALVPIFAVAEQLLWWREHRD